MRILTVALREFKATTFTKAFFIGVVVVPLLLTALVPLAMVLINLKPPAVSGSVAIIDRTGQVAPLLRDRISPEAIAERVNETSKLVAEAGAKAAEKHLSGPTGSAVSSQVRASTQRIGDEAAATAPKLSVEILDSTVTDEEAKAPLMSGDVKSGGRLVLVVIKPHAVEPATEKRNSRSIWILAASVRLR